MSAAPFTHETMLPDLFRRFPQTRAVFDRYGLTGCGGAKGPMESIHRFATIHGVDETKLMRDLEAAVERPAAAEESRQAAAAMSDAVADSIYRRYFLAGIALILTAGATWGAWLLWNIGLSGSFTSVSIHHVNAHGHAQIYGWVGLFIMGFALQAFPRMWQTRLARPRLAVAAFGLMLTGLIVRTVGMTGPAALGDCGLHLSMIGGAMEIVAIGAFVWQIGATYRRSGAAMEPYVGFAFGALAWFVIQAVFCVWHTWTTMTAGTREELLWYISTYQAPLRDVQIHGLALFMILGVSMRMLPAMYDVPRTPVRRAWWALGVLAVAVIGESVVFVAYRWSHNHALAALLMVPWVMLAVGAAMVAMPWKLWRPLPVSDRSAKFIRAAYAWLAISLVMLLMLPVYQAVADTPFSHAYYGSIRHAITVGFISLMIMGMAAKVVPTLNGVDPARLPSLWGPFLLVNLGCFLRVSLQTLTDFHPLFFVLVGISGTLEVTGLAWWGLGLAKIMIRGRREQCAASSGAGPAASYVTLRPPQILAEHHVADVLDWYPQTEAVFLRHGFMAIRNVVLRRTVARRTTLRTAASIGGVDLSRLLGDLNTAREAQPVAVTVAVASN